MGGDGGAAGLLSPLILDLELAIGSNVRRRALCA